LSRKGSVAIALLSLAQSIGKSSNASEACKLKLIGARISFIFDADGASIGNFWQV
jgi:hypothetical protein